jgi:hypothetical protein
MKKIISLCDHTGNAVQPWADAGYECWILDIKHPAGFEKPENNIKKIGMDVTDFDVTETFEFAFAFPPCTDLAVSGARWFKEKGLERLAEAIRIFAVCARLCVSFGCPFLIDNPVSVISSHYRKPDYTFDPCEYSGYLTNYYDEAYTKKTCLWTGGGFVMPEPKPVFPIMGSKMHLMQPGKDRASLRSETPKGFSKAVFLANHKTGEIK